MNEFILTHEPWIRLSLFGGVLLLMSVIEAIAPRRKLHAHKPLRWTHNFLLVAINTLVLRLLLPLGAVAVAIMAEQADWGLLRWANLPSWAAIVIAVIALDLVIYLQHVLFHSVPALWRVHRVHHADLDFDVTTGLRFHAIEIVLSMGIKMGIVAALGPPAVAVVIFEVLLNATSMFNHTNLRMPTWLDRFFRFFLVTPDMHRVHHSVLREETNSNFGFNLPWWDYLFGTYRAQPARGHEEMTIGVENLRDEHQVQRLPGMLLLPFVADVDESYPVDASLSAGPRTADPTFHPRSPARERSMVLPP